MAGNPFDEMKNNAFDIVKTTMGYDASWSPSNGSPEILNRVLFREPTHRERELFAEYDPNQTFMEYRAGDGFDTLLFDLVRAGEVETIDIETTLYYVREIQRKWDGDTYLALLEEIV